MIDSKVKAALTSLNVPVARIFYDTEKRGNADTFITFQLIYRRETEFFDDTGAAREHLYRADIFSKSDFTALLADAENALKRAGFYDIEVETEIFESDTGFYHIPVQFYFTEFYSEQDEQ